jgi:hypothetical protein
METTSRRRKDKRIWKRRADVEKTSRDRNDEQIPQLNPNPSKSVCCPPPRCSVEPGSANWPACRSTTHACRAHRDSERGAPPARSRSPAGDGSSALDTRHAAEDSNRRRVAGRLIRLISGRPTRPSTAHCKAARISHPLLRRTDTYRPSALECKQCRPPPILVSTSSSGRALSLAFSRCRPR